eukprot:2219774-Pleurochrysis_carterae.AAC.1
MCEPGRRWTSRSVAWPRGYVHTLREGGRALGAGASAHRERGIAPIRHARPRLQLRCSLHSSVLRL